MVFKGLCLTIGSALLISLAGCNEQPTRYPVAGKVVIDGKPVTTGSIQFVPADGRPFASKIASDGSFRLKEMSIDKNPKPDGIAPGTYQIGVSSAEVLDEDKGEVLKHIPGKYADFRTSELEVEIDAPKEDMLIELTWEGAEELAEEEVDEDEKEGEESSAIEVAEPANAAAMEASNQE